MRGLDSEDIFDQKYRSVFLFLMIQEYNVFVFKEPFHPTEPGYFRYIEKNYGLILKDYSETFCKMELIQDTNTLVETGITNEKDCYRTFE